MALVESVQSQTIVIVRDAIWDNNAIIDRIQEFKNRLLGVGQAIIRLRRGTSELAQVQISDVRPRFSLAQVLPDTLKGQLQTGDIVVFNP